MAASRYKQKLRRLSYGPGGFLFGHNRAGRRALLPSIGYQELDRLALPEDADAGALPLEYLPTGLLGQISGYQLLPDEIVLYQ